MRSFLVVAAITLLLLQSSRAQEWKLVIARPSAPASVTVPAGYLIEIGDTIHSAVIDITQTLDFGGGAVYLGGAVVSPSRANAMSDL